MGNQEAIQRYGLAVASHLLLVAVWHFFVVLGKDAALDAASERVRVVEHGRTLQGRPINMFIVGYPTPPPTAEEVSDSPTALVNCNVHGNEPSSREACLILARELAGKIDLSAFPPEIAGWLQRAFSPDPDDRFPDAAVMQAEWRTAATAVLERERRLPWWRRIFGGDETGDGWWREGDAVIE